MSPTASPQRISGRSDVDAPLWLRAFFRFQRMLYGVTLEPTRVWSRAPAAMRGFVDFFAAVDRRSSPIEPALRSLIMVRVSQINACAYCVDINGWTLQKRGVTMEKLSALPDYGTSLLFSPKERVALDYASAMTFTTPGVEDELFARLRLYFTDDEIVELTALVALQNASSKFNAALAIPAQGFCTVPPSRE